MLAQALISHDRWNAALVTSTNVDGSVLRLEFAAKEVIAGDRLLGRMVISNAATEFRQLRYEMTKRRDSYIGDLLVIDQDGNRIPKTVWSSLQDEALWSKGRTAFLWPSNSSGFNVDLVGRYSLTNPGVYLVKAVAQVPMPLDVHEDVVVETPPVAVTVLPRPEGAPLPEPLYTAAELARIPKSEEPPMMQVTPPRSRTRPAGTGIGAHPVFPKPLTSPQERRDALASSNATDIGNTLLGMSHPPADRTRGKVLAGIIVACVLAALTIILRATRRRTSSKVGR